MLIYRRLSHVYLIIWPLKNYNLSRSSSNLLKNLILGILLLFVAKDVDGPPGGVYEMH